MKSNLFPFSPFLYSRRVSMSQNRKTRKSRSRQNARTTHGVVEIPKPSIEVITEKTYVTTEPELEIRKAGTLAQALTEPAVAVVKPKSKVRKEVVARTRRSA